METDTRNPITSFNRASFQLEIIVATILYNRSEKLLFSFYALITAINMAVTTSEMHYPPPDCAHIYCWVSVNTQQILGTIAGCK